MPTALDLRALALEMKTAQDSVHQVEPFTTRLPAFDLSAAYEVAHLIHRARLAEGAKPVGRKIGFTNPDMWSKFGVREPIWAYIYDTTVVRLNDAQTTCRLGRFVEPKIEPEIVFGFRTAPRTGAGLFEVLNAIDWVAHGFEIVQSHFPGWRFQAPDTVADCALHGTLLVGPPQPLLRLGTDAIGALESFTLTLSCDGRTIETAKGSNVLGNPLSAITHLLSVLAKQPDHVPLHAGEIVTTGTVTTAQSVRAGETWRSEVHGIALPGLTVAFSA
jgi:2-oxo-3-hexenedioate decarboxylase